MYTPLGTPRPQQNPFPYLKPFLEEHLTPAQARDPRKVARALERHPRAAEMYKALRPFKDARTQAAMIGRQAGVPFRVALWILSALYIAVKSPKPRLSFGREHVRAPWQVRGRGL